MNRTSVISALLLLPHHHVYNPLSAPQTVSVVPPLCLKHRRALLSSVYFILAFIVVMVFSKRINTLFALPKGNESWLDQVFSFLLIYFTRVTPHLPSACFPLCLLRLSHRHRLDTVPKPFGAEFPLTVVYSDGLDNSCHVKKT